MDLIMKAFYKNSLGEKYKIQMVTEDENEINMILDQMKGTTYITEKEFLEDGGRKIILDIKNNNKKVAELTFNYAYIEGKGDDFVLKIR